MWIILFVNLSGPVICSISIYRLIKRKLVLAERCRAVSAMGYYARICNDSSKQVPEAETLYTYCTWQGNKVPHFLGFLSFFVIHSLPHDFSWAHMKLLLLLYCLVYFNDFVLILACMLCIFNKLLRLGIFKRFLHNQSSYISTS